MDESMIRHKELAESGRWAALSFAEQMANVGSEVFRAGKWKSKGKIDRSRQAADRALELLDFTVSARIAEQKSPRELLRIRELLCDYYYGHNEYASTVESLSGYFDPFYMKATRQRGV